MIVLSSVMWFSIYGLVIKNDVKFWVGFAKIIIIIYYNYDHNGLLQC